MSRANAAYLRDIYIYIYIYIYLRMSFKWCKALAILKRFLSQLARFRKSPGTNSPLFEEQIVASAMSICSRLPKGRAASDGFRCGRSVGGSDSKARGVGGKGQGQGQRQGEGEGEGEGERDGEGEGEGGTRGAEEEETDYLGPMYVRDEEWLVSILLLK
jgi:hypothetical protein